MIILIAAMTQDRVIGINNKIPWNIPEDMEHFKRTTTNHAIVMGRKTFESIGRPLPNRYNIVVSRTMHPKEGILVCRNVPEALQKASHYSKDVYVIGGATIYEQALAYAEKLVITFVKKRYQGDAYFPAFSQEEWYEYSRQEFDEYYLIEYRRVKTK